MNILKLIKEFLQIIKTIKSMRNCATKKNTKIINN